MFIKFIKIKILNTSLFVYLFINFLFNYLFIYYVFIKLYYKYAKFSSFKNTFSKTYRTV